jgi:hypothetical protein
MTRIAAEMEPATGKLMLQGFMTGRRPGSSLTATDDGIGRAGETPIARDHRRRSDPAPASDQPKLVTAGAGETPNRRRPSRRDAARQSAQPDRDPDVTGR